MYDFTNKDILTIEQIKNTVVPIAKKYKAAEVYLFGSYARGEAREDSDLDFLVFGGDEFHLTDIFAVAEELRELFNKRVDMFEICEINTGTPFYDTVMREKVRIV